MIELLVQIDDHAAPDPHLERVAVGTLLRIEGPFGSFELRFPLRERRLVFVAGGTGIAPLRSMMWETLLTQPEISIAVVYSARSRDEFAYSHELKTLADAGRIDLTMTVTRDAAGWSGSRGRIQRGLVERLILAADTRCVICGPPGLVADAGALLREVGVAPEQILTETYAAE